MGHRADEGDQREDEEERNPVANPSKRWEEGQTVIKEAPMLLLTLFVSIINVLAMVWYLIMLLIIET